MVKESNIMLRVEAETKQRISDAARHRGKNLTTFILEAAMRQVERVEGAKPRQTVSGACPSFFRALCLTATSGGSTGYDNAAHELTRHLATEQPYELDGDEWDRRLDQLDKLLGSRLDTDEQILAWFDTNMPRCMALVPERRRATFLRGVRNFYEKHGLER